MARRNAVGIAGVFAWFVACGGSVDVGSGEGGTTSAGGAIPGRGGAPGSGGKGIYAGRSGEGGSAVAIVGGSVSLAGGASSAGGYISLAGGASSAGGFFFGLAGALSAGTTSRGGATVVGAGGRMNTGGVASEGGYAGAGGEGGFGTLCEGDYVACGCGCCGGTGALEPTDCYYPDYGETRGDIVAKDLAQKTSPSCANTGCSLPRIYTCCATVPAGTQPASKYLAFYSTGQIELAKFEVGETTCTFLTFARGSEVRPVFHTNSAYSWSGVAERRACASAVKTDKGIGIAGNLSLTPNGGTCRLSAHATVFVSIGNGSVYPVRIDLDDFDAAIPGSECQ